MSVKEKTSTSVSFSSENTNRGILITGLIVAMLFASLDNTIVGTALPRIVGELGGLGVMTWLTTAYMLSSTAVIPVAGKLADMIGRKSVYLTGLVIFIVGSALCGTSETMGQLIGYRALQGIGGGVMMPMAMIIVGDIFTGEQRAKWQGVFGAVFGLSSIIGLQVGGWIVDSLNWRWVFYINLPVGVLAMVFIAIGLTNQRQSEKVTIDYAGIVTMILGVISLLLALTFGGKDYPWTSWQIISLFLFSAIMIIWFIRIEQKTSEPILPMSLFANKLFSILSSVGFLMSVGMFGAIMFVPLYMQGILGVSAADSGTAMFPMMIAMIVASVIGGRIVYKIGFRPQIIAGMITMAIGFWLLSTMQLDTSEYVAMSYMVVLGLGMGLVMPLLTLALQESFPKSELGVVTSSSQFFRQIGGTFGMTILGAVMNHHSTTLLSNQLVPLLEDLPPQASEIVTEFESMIQTNPQGMYSILLSPETMQQIPDEIKTILLPILKTSLVDSLHYVFLYGLGFIVLGAILTPFISVKLTPKSKQASS
ncbi:MDR family MFS transporter [Brevibacillus sp. SYSU BS000544]|uniref:MDR family MFS transporter n=1 Tax=Brevibacillus sp. SYSU BS000544 TaxID=3416443 RepID=UPI003CE46FDA